MKLVFASNHLVRNQVLESELLNQLAKRNSNSIVYIPAQSDLSRIYFEETKSYYCTLGIKDVDYLDIDQEYDYKRIDLIQKAGAIHLGGGSTFDFLHNIRRRQIDNLLLSYAQNSGLIIGVSAGAIIMTPRIDSSILCGDPVLAGLKSEGLNLVNWEFLPHFESILNGEKVLQDYSMKSNNIIYACNDGDGIVLEGDNLRLIGEIRAMRNGEWL